jgi:Ca-activated chloride channel family protein
MVFILSLLPQMSLADGFIIPIPPPHWQPPEPPQLSIKYHDVNVTIEDGVVRTEVDQVFLNDYDVELEGTYIFPLPEDAAVDEFAMYVDGERVNGEIMDAQQAREKYEDLLRQLRDPAILEYVGRNAFQARVYPIPANGEKRVQLAYSQVLSPDAGLYLYRYPLDTERFTKKPLEKVEVNISLSSQLPILNVYSPSHDVDVERVDNYHVKVHYQEKNTKPDKDLVLFYQLDNEGVGVSLLTNKESGEDGSFLLMMTPQYYQENVSEALPKDIVFVYDRSGSMSGDKIEQTQKAIIYCLQNLHPQDNFDVIAFGSDVKLWQEGLVPASEANVDDAVKFLKDIPARGGTNINDALLQALAQLNPDSYHPQMVIFLTDGAPTVGVTDNVKIVDQVKSANSKVGARLYIFGVGYDVNAVLLDHLSRELSGISQYVIPDENIEVAVSNFYSKVSLPVLANVKLDFGDISVYDVQPIDMPDLFSGNQLIITGRYKGSGYTTLTVRGDVNGEPQVLEYPLNFRSDKNSFVPVIWARRYIGYLLEEIRINGENKELVDEIKDLALQYGIVTPYTSFYIGEVTKTENANKLVYGMDEAAKEKLQGYHMDSSQPMVKSPETLASAPSSGSGGVSISQDLRAMQEGREEYASEVVKVVEDKTFYLIDGIWTDNQYAKDMPVTEVKFATSEYLQLLVDYPGIGKYLSLGNNLVLVMNGTAYKIVE